MDEEHVIHGEKLNAPVPTISVGIQLHNILKENEERPVLTDAVTGNIMLNTTLVSTACRLAQSLQNFRLQKNDIIAVCSENSIYYYNAILAGLFSGITVTTFSPQYTEGELIYVANISQPGIIFCSLQTSITALKVKDKLKRTPTLIIIDQKENYKGCLSVENFILQHIPIDFDENSYQPTSVNVNEDVAFILYSSGTSGLPKGVLLTHLNVNAVIAIYLYGNFTETTPLIAFLPFYHAYGLLMVFKMVLFKSFVLVMNKFIPHVYLRTVEKYKIDYLQLVPPIAQFLAKTDDLHKYDLSSVKKIYCGGAPLSRDVQETLCKRFNLDGVRQGYGLTETTLAIIGHLRDKTYPRGSVGNVLIGMSVKIVDVETGKSLGPMEPGEVCCRGNAVMKGYLNNLEATVSAIDDKGWLHTGDIGYYDHNNAFYIVDRVKELIKCKGHQVAPAELENLLISHPKIADAGVIGVPDERSGEVPFAFIVKLENQTLSEKEVTDFIADKVAPYKQLRGGVKFVSEIPKSPSGKILRRLMRNELKHFKSNL